MFPKSGSFHEGDREEGKSEIFADLRPEICKMLQERNNSLLVVPEVGRLLSCNCSTVLQFVPFFY